jgi:hypothetical protein
VKKMKVNSNMTRFGKRPKEDFEVICVDNSFYGVSLTLGKKYAPYKHESFGIPKLNDQFIICGDDGVFQTFSKERFKDIRKWRKERIVNLLGEG